MEQLEVESMLKLAVFNSTYFTASNSPMYSYGYGTCLLILIFKLNEFYPLYAVNR
jgi:hypothetical protein